MSGEPGLLELAQAAELIAGLPEDPGAAPLLRLERALVALRGAREVSEREQAQSEAALHKLESTLRALRAASRVVESVASAFQREKVLAAIPDALMRTFGAATARVWLLGPGDRCASCAQASRCADRTQCLHLVEQGARGPLDLALLRVPLGDYSVGRVATERRAIVSNHLEAEPGLADPDWARVEHIRAFAGQPLTHEGKLLGAVAMWSRAPIREEMAEALRLLAHHAATAIAGSELLETVQRESARSQEAATRLSALLDAERNGVVLFDESDRAAYVNGAFRELFGLSDRPLVGLRRDELEAVLTSRRAGAGGPILIAPGEAAEGHAQVPWESPARGEALSVLRPGDVAPRVFERYAAQVRSPSGTAHGWMAVFDDVSAAREIDRAKSEFISTVSHELRTPLTSIQGALALLRDRPQGSAPFDPESEQLLQVSSRNAERLARLVSDILDISKLESGRLELHTRAVAPAQLCAQAAQAVSPLLPAREIALEVDAPESLPRVQADFDRVQQVLANLLSNALKFSPPGGTVRLRARLSAGRAHAPGKATQTSAGMSCVRFEVDDRGPGVPLQFREQLFRSFAQSARSEQEQSGTGLGLAICQALVRKHGGQIGCESTPGEGATFFFTLPLA